MILTEEAQRKWAPVLQHPDLPKIVDAHRRAVTAVILENTENALREAGRQMGYQHLLGEAAPTNSMGASSSTAADGAIDTFDPVLISLVRRSMPNLIAYDICGVQPMTGPTGLIFAMRARFTDQTSAEALYNEANTSFSSPRVPNTAAFGNGQVGTAPSANSNVSNALYNMGIGLPLANAEALGTTSHPAIPEMAFSIEKVTVTALSRALKAEYSMELAQDLKAIHGLDAETELSNILSAEILAEINREVIRTINITAVRGANTGTTTAGVFDLDTDSNGRWSVEKFKGLMFQVERECNQIAKDTRRGKGNILICSSDVASALQMAGVLDYTPAMAVNLQVDDTGSTFAGTLNGRIKVYIDPYFSSSSGKQYFTLGYKGSSAFDAGLFYCPYVPLQMVRAVGQDTFQPKIGFKTRYGIVANPFATADANGIPARLGSGDGNKYYRFVAVTNLM